jgi:hypothetical protein
MSKQQITMKCHGVNCGLASICERFDQYGAFCPSRDIQTIEHCDEETRDCFIHAE